MLYNHIFQQSVRDIRLLTGLCALCFLCFSSYSQTEKEKKLLREAEKNYNARKYRLALQDYLNLYKMDSVHFKDYFALGVCYFNSPAEKNKSIPFFEKAIRNSEDTIPILFYYLAQAYHLAYRFDDAVTEYQRFKIYLRPNSFGQQLNRELDRRIEQCHYGKVLISKPAKVIIHNLGQRINSSYPDYAPVVSADESVLIFTSRRKGSTGGLTDENNEFFEDIYISKNEHWQWTMPAKIDTGQEDMSEEVKAKIPLFGKAKKISRKINTESHDAAIGLSSDGQTLFIYRDENIYVSTLDGRKWSIPAKLNSNINYKSSRQPSISISGDGKTIYFVSDRKGGYGGKDIYKSEKSGNGEWGQAVNLGPTINTAYNEDSPFIHSDGKTLYFSSQGHVGMGGYDIFKVVYTDNRWSSPENIGYPVNTTGDDIYYIVTAKGNHAYFSSVRDSSVGDMDIYLLLFEGVSVPVTEISGIVRGGNPLVPMQATIKLTDKESGNEILTAISNSVTGKYLLVLPPNKNYVFEITAPGYRTHSENIFIPDQKEFYKLFQEIQLVPVQVQNGTKVGQEVNIRNAFFNIEKEIQKNSELSQELKNTNAVDSATASTVIPEQVYLKYVEQIASSEKVSHKENENQENEKQYNEIKKLDYFVPADSLAKTLNLSVETMNCLMNRPPEEARNILQMSVLSIEKLCVLSPKTISGLFKLKAETVEQVLKLSYETINKMAPLSVDSIVLLLSHPVDSIPLLLAKKHEKIKTISVSGREDIMLFTCLFDINKYAMSGESTTELGKIISESNINTKFEISGHADSTGETYYNLLLSERRAKMVMNYLKEKGIKNSRMKIYSFGETQPIASNETDEGRRQNRRVEIKIIRNK